jgi:hypothetical protein
MSKGKVVALLLAMLVLVPSVSGCTGFSSQGPQEQQRPAEKQNAPTEDTEETFLDDPSKEMEETAKEEQTEKK